MTSTVTSTTSSTRTAPAGRESAIKRTGALILILAALALLSPAGCSKPKPKPEPTAKAPLTERQRDSLLARQPIPGAGGVGRALDLSDREAARAAGLGAQVDSLTR